MTDDEGTERGRAASPGDRAPDTGKPQAALGMPGNPLTLTDPGMMRALAHPARMAIMIHLAAEGPATATECASVAELSPSACSYHLRTLARYGMVEEETSADGRERPWRAKIVSYTIHDSPGMPTAVRAAGQMLVAAGRAATEEIRERFEDRKPEYPARWQEAAGGMNSVVHVTPDELDELRRRALDLYAEYIRLDQAERPPSAKRVLVVADFTPWFDPDEADS